MLLRLLVQGSALALVLTTSSWARAQCTMDTECKGDRLCEAGKCVAPPPAAALAPAAAAKPAAADPAPVTAHAPAPVAASVPVVPPAPASEPPKMRRHSTGMMVGGIVMVSLAPVAFLVAGAYGLSSAFCSSSNYSCDEYATAAKVSLLGGLILAGVGVPLIVVGGSKEPVTEEGSASISPWATPSAAGLALRLSL